MSHFIEFHFFFLRAYFLKPFVLLQYGLLLSLPLVPYVGTIASWSPRYPLSCFLFPVSLKNTSMEESRHPHVRVGEAAAGGDPWASLTGRLQCCLQAAGCTFAGKSPGTCRLRYVPWSYALSLEENSLALCLLAYVQQSEPEHVAKRGVGDLMPGGKGADRVWDGWTASPVQWTCVWANHGKQWKRGRPVCCSQKGLDMTQWMNNSN